jgi:Circularly permutated YpsA SLOG family
MVLKKIISGGQTGVDQAALDVAISFGIDHGGWIPKGRRTEAGKLPDKYMLKEMPTSSYPKRTEQNVIDSDGTLIISHGRLSVGSRLTNELANKHNRPCLHIDLNKTPAFIASSKINS